MNLIDGNGLQSLFRAEHIITKKQLRAEQILLSTDFSQNVTYVTMELKGGAPKHYKLVFKPRGHYGYLRIINHTYRSDKLSISKYYPLVN